VERGDSWLGRSGSGYVASQHLQGCSPHCDILTHCLIVLIEYSYHQGIPSFPEAQLKRTLRLSVLDLEKFQDG
jgi:hypothetical protein